MRKLINKKRSAFAAHKGYGDVFSRGAGKKAPFLNNRFPRKKSARLFVFIVLGLLILYSAAAENPGAINRENSAPALKEGSAPVQDVMRQDNLPAAAEALNRVKVSQVSGQFPLYFIANKGQVNQQARFYAKTPGYTLWLTKGGLVFDSVKTGKSPKSETQNPGQLQNPNSRQITNPKSQIPKETEIMDEEFLTPPRVVGRDVSRLMFLGARENPEIVPFKEAKLKVNYFKGRDKSKWRCDVPTSEAVLYRNLYKNIHLKVYGIEKQVEYDWIVEPGADPARIRFAYEGVKSTRIDKDGNLRIQTVFGELVHKQPVSYQTAAENLRNPVDVKFKKFGKNTYGFALGEYDKTRRLVIDPVILTYSTYLAGSGVSEAQGVAVDEYGFIYVTGTTISMDFPIRNEYMADPGNSKWDAFLTKINPHLCGMNSLVYSTYLTGNDYETDGGRAVVVDDNQCVYLTGYTQSEDFPVKNGYQEKMQGARDVFVTKIDTRICGEDGLIYSTYLGGDGLDNSRDIVLGNNGIVYVTGYTESFGTYHFPLRGEYMGDPGDGNYRDVFVAKIDTGQSGDSSLLYSTYLGGLDEDNGISIDVDSSGNVYITGWTDSVDFPTTNPCPGDPGDSDADVFVTKIDPSLGSAGLIFSTYLTGPAASGNKMDRGYGIAVDGSGAIYVAGSTTSSNFPTKNKYMGEPGDGAADAFLTKMTINESSPDGYDLLYSTYLGGDSTDWCLGMALGSGGCVYLTGHANGSFPLRCQYEYPYPGNPPGVDVFVAKIDTTLEYNASLRYSTYLGGSDYERGWEIAADSSGNAYVAGYTESTDYPVVCGYMGDPGNGKRDAFVSKLEFFTSPLEVLSPNGGECLVLCASETITWDAPCTSMQDNLTIILWQNDVKLGIIAKDVDPASGSYDWVVGLLDDGSLVPSGEGYKIKIRNKNTGEAALSDNPFTISLLKVTSPRCGGKWPLGSTRYIAWEAPCVDGKIEISLWQDGGLVGVIHHNFDPLPAYYEWVVGECIGGPVPMPPGIYQIRIKDNDTGEYNKCVCDFEITN